MGSRVTSVWFRIDELVGVVHSADLPFLDSFRRLYYEPADPRADPFASYLVHVDRRLAPTKRHSIARGPDFQQLVLVTAFYPSLLAALEQDINRRVVSTLRHRCLLRAGAVASGGRGIVVAGDYESGRNHLVQALVARGCQYFGDAVVILRRPDLRLLPFPKSLGQRRAATPLAAFGREDAPFRQRGKMTARFLPPPSPGLRPDSAGPEVDLVLFPRLAEDAARPRLTPVSPATAAMLLAGNLLRHEAGLAGTFQDISRLAAAAESYEIEVGTGKPTTDLLFERLLPAVPEEVAAGPWEDR